MKRIFCPALIVSLLVFGCGATPPRTGSIVEGGGAVKMRHQILFKSADSEHVFEGYMLLGQDAFLVKAFAGPGVDLFTIVHKGDDHKETLHIQELKDRIDVGAIGEEIARIYLGGCGRGARGEEVECELLGQRMTEVYDEQGRLSERRFPDAHGVGLTVRYYDYCIWSGRTVSKRIELSWGRGGNRMEIRLVGLETVKEVDPDIFKAR